MQRFLKRTPTAEEFLASIRTGDEKRAKIFLDAHKDQHHILSEVRRTAVMAALESEQIKIMRLFIEKEFVSPLLPIFMHEAVRRGNIEMVRLLAKARPWKDDINAYYELSICAAAKAGRADLLEIFLSQKDAPTSLRSSLEEYGGSKGFTPLDLAKRNGNSAAVKVIQQAISNRIDAEVKERMRNPIKLTPPHYVNPRVSEKRCAEAIKAGDESTVVQFITEDRSHTNSYFNNRNKFDHQTDHTMLTQAAFGPPSILRAILEGRADPNRESNSSITALYIAAGCGNLENVALLLQYGANPNAIFEPNGRTALMHAALYGHASVVEKLLAVSDLALRDNNGDTATDIAEKAGHKELAAFLRNPAAQKAQAFNATTSASAAAAVTNPRNAETPPPDFSITDAIKQQRVDSTTSIRIGLQHDMEEENFAARPRVAGVVPRAARFFQVPERQMFSEYLGRDHTHFIAILGDEGSSNRVFQSYTFTDPILSRRAKFEQNIENERSVLEIRNFPAEKRLKKLQSHNNILITIDSSLAIASLRQQIASLITPLRSDININFLVINEKSSSLSPEVIQILNETLRINNTTSKFAIEVNPTTKKNMEEAFYMAACIAAGKPIPEELRQLNLAQEGYQAGLTDNAAFGKSVVKPAHQFFSPKNALDDSIPNFKINVAVFCPTKLSIPAITEHMFTNRAHNKTKVYNAISTHDLSATQTDIDKDTTAFILHLDVSDPNWESYIKKMLEMDKWGWGTINHQYFVILSGVSEKNIEKATDITQKIQSSFQGKLNAIFPVETLNATKFQTIMQSVAGNVVQQRFDDFKPSSPKHP
jgi:ankyrin repeat protein